MRASIKEFGPKEAQNGCIFLAVQQGFQARYLLRTDILPELKKRIGKIVILSPNAEEEYFRNEFHRDHVIVEKFDTEKCEDFLLKSRGQRFFRLVRSFILNGKYDIQTVDDIYRLFLKESTGIQGRRKIRLLVIDLLVKRLRASKVLRQFFLRLEGKLFQPDIHKDLFERHSPDLVVTTSLGNVGRGFDLFVMREAKKHGAKIVPVILSWDNTTGKGLGGVIPDNIIAWTDIMKGELMMYHDIPGNRIFVGGIAHFDIYYRKELSTSREKALESLGLDPSKKLIFFGTKSPNSYPWNADIARILAEAIDQGQFPFPTQLLIRLHPLYYVVKKTKTREFVPFSKEFEWLAQKYSFVKIDRPQILSDRLTMDMPESEQTKLASILTHTDVLVNMFSTLNIEAAILDVPLVNVVFEGKAERRENSRQNIDIDFRQTHNQRIVRSGATRLCHTPQELIETVRAYLVDRSLDRSERAALVQQEAGLYKGTAGRKIAEILSNLTKNPD